MTFMTSRMALAAWCLVLASVGAAESLHVIFLEPAEIESRLRLATQNNAERMANLRELFERCGCSGERLTSLPVKGVKQPNLQCTMAGQSDSVILVGAHYDADAHGTGAVDNWSGAALLPSLYQSLAGQPRRHTFIFVGFSGEEAGLIGSRTYARSIPKQDRARYRAVINLDTLGLTDTKVWVSHSDPKLFSLLASVAGALQLPIAGVNVERVGSTDSEAFRSREIPVLTIHSVTQETWHVLHSRQDTVDAIDQTAYYRTYRLATAYLAYLDGKLD